MEKATTKTNILRGKRAQFDFSQTDIANRLGITMTTYGKKERGDIDFSQSEIYALKNLFELKDEEIIQIFFEAQLPKC